MKRARYTVTGKTQEVFTTAPLKTLTDRQRTEIAAGIETFTKYLREKYEYISKIDMLTQEKEARQEHGLTVSQAIEVWNEIYGIANEKLAR